jgi:hypothetical protein
MKFEIENTIKEVFENFEAEITSEIWKNIESEINPK